MILTMIAAGCLGGAAYFLIHFQDVPSPAFQSHLDHIVNPRVRFLLGHSWNLVSAIILGIAASAVVPVFLHATSSDLISEIQKKSQADPDVQQGSAVNSTPVGLTSVPEWYVYFGFCILAAFGAPRFLQAVSDRVINELETQKRQLKAVSEAAEQALVDARTAMESTQTLIDSASEPSSTEGLMISESAMVGNNHLETRILSAMRDAKAAKNWQWRVPKGISDELGVDVSTILVSLESLKEAGLVTKIAGAHGDRWGITSAGCLKCQPPQVGVKGYPER